MAIFLLYLGLGVICVMLLHRLLRSYTDMPVDEVKKAGFWTAGIGLVLASIFSPFLRRLAFLAMVFAPWKTLGARTRASGHGTARARMHVQEAREVLGVGEEAGREEIEAAYRRLMRLNHPDHGGSEYFAKKLNEAREVLLKGKP